MFVENKPNEEEEEELSLWICVQTNKNKKKKEKEERNLVEQHFWIRQAKHKKHENEQK